jgi:hypothetical protein
LTLGKELIMWDDDPEMMDPLEDSDEEYEHESESDEDLSELPFDSAIAEEVEDDTFDKDGGDFDDED